MANPVRVLQVLADTDASAANMAAVELHSALSGAGVEMRTLALAPGRWGALADTVPAIAPGRRSIAAHTQLHAEQRWADVVVLHGAAAASVAALAGGDVARVLALWDEPQRWDGGARVPARTRRLARRCAAVVVGWPAAVGGTARRLGLPSDQVHVAATPISTAAAPTPAARAAARAALGVAETQLAVRLFHDPTAPAAAASSGTPATALSAAALSAALGDGMVVLGPCGPDQLEHEQRRELERIAADVVVALDVAGGPSPEVLRTIASGATFVAPATPAVEGLLRDDLTGRVLPTPASTERVVDAVRSVADPELRASLGDAARVAVHAQHGTELVRGRWLDLVHSALPSRP